MGFRVGPEREDGEGWKLNIQRMGAEVGGAGRSKIIISIRFGLVFPLNTHVIPHSPSFFSSLHDAG